MFYTVYRTTNLVNGKYYFGVHKTDNPEDGYLGSGTYIKHAVAKYGFEKFRKGVLFVFDETNAAAAFAKEDELIQCYRGRDPLCMNLRRGGDGGFDYINRELSGEWRVRAAAITNSKVREKRRLDPAYALQDTQQRRVNGSYSRTVESRKQTAERTRKVWTGRSHSLETKRKMSEARKRFLNTAQSSSGLGHLTLNEKIAGSNPAWATNYLICTSPP
jgi:hypothetical protein